MVLSELLGVSDRAARVYAGIILVLIGFMHFIDPAGSGVGSLLSMIDGVEVTNQISNLPGLLTRVVGVSVFGVGLDVFSDAY